MLLFSILAILLIAEVQSQSCLTPLTSSGIDKNQAHPLLQTGSITIQNSDPSSSSISADVTFKQELIKVKIPQVAVSPVFIENYVVPEEQANRKIGFQASRVIKQAKFTILFLIDENSMWTSVTINYIANSLETIRVGMFLADSPLLLQSDSKQATITHQLSPPWKVPFEEIKTLFFISGFQTNNLDLEIKIDESRSTILSPQMLSVVVETINKKSAIKVLSFSYLIFTNVQSETGVTPLTNPVNQITNSLKSKEIVSSGSFYNVFIGMTDFNGAKLFGLFQSNARLLLAPSIFENSTSPSIIQAFNNAFNVDGLSFQFTLDTPSIMTGQTNEQVICVTSQQCTQQNGIQYFDSNQGRLFCYICPQNLTYNFSQQQCVCKQNFYIIQFRKCVALDNLCAPNQFFSNGRCISILISSPIGCGLNQIYNTSSGFCECDKYYQPKINGSIFSCVYICDERTQIVNEETGMCECLNGNIDYLGKCVNCSNITEKWNSVEKKCECASPPYYNVTSLGVTKCRKCSENSVYMITLKKCICNQGYIGDGQICRKVKYILLPQR